MSGWSAAIAAGSQLLDTMIRRNDARSKNFEGQVRAAEWHRQDTRYQRAVKDARAAGLHPLFALGTGQSYGGTMTMGGTGNYGGGGIAAAGEAVARGIERHGRKKRQDVIDKAAGEIHELTKKKLQGEIALDDLEAQRRASELARNTQEMNYRPRMLDDGAVVVPLPESGNINLNPLPRNRPTRQEPNVNAPLWTTLTSPSGEKYRILSEAAQGDELNQLLIAAQAGWSEFLKVGNEFARRGIIDPAGFGRDAYTFFKNLGRKKKLPYHRRNRK